MTNNTYEHITHSHLINKNSIMTSSQFCLLTLNSELTVHSRGHFQIFMEISANVGEEGSCHNHNYYYQNFSFEAKLRRVHS